MILEQFYTPEGENTVKRLVALTALVFVFVINTAFAATPTTEPSLPGDLATWQKESATCTKHAGKTLVSSDYVQMAADSLKVMMVITLNGEKVVQGEVTQGANPKFVIYVRNSPEKNWLAYTQKENAEAFKRFLDEVGLTQEQFNACGE
ncbi:MAG: hypothetical protein A3H76_00075 [Candidatus Lloydbacteria bacterium RIFCSPLOWO2_02_FULL_54_12]|nr:MAG: hypothetical protein A2948_03415 [Candidatus Lloydbacteria bacterium RIFCSPLOWO2_01_FULL_54_18]OGZ16687.1 MAG: hypothetical protein A3H76_00075 [Candidatus Lloydbacteria bacterium RIFCSPLOWO2_02_FULL_54_12]